MKFPRGNPGQVNKEVPLATGGWGKMQGGFKGGERDGQGTYKGPDGFAYEGEWQAGQISGKGVATYANGTRLEGTFRNGEFLG